MERIRDEYIKDVESGLDPIAIRKKYGKQPLWFLGETDIPIPRYDQFRKEAVDENGIEYQYIKDDTSSNSLFYAFRFKKNVPLENRNVPSGNILLNGSQAEVLSTIYMGSSRPATGGVFLRFI